jgi:GT2 family glycosyltransferase
MANKKRAAIISVIYQEPEWKQTKACIEASGADRVIFVDRKGFGSLAKAYNKGFVGLGSETFDYVWFVSNPIFKEDTLDMLVDAMNRSGYAGIHPSFNSDHQHIQNNGTCLLLEAPFIEFTAPIVRHEVFAGCMLDERMPYWGHDLDWSYRVRQAGLKVGVNHGVELEHSYLRNKRRLPITVRRMQARAATDRSTRQRLIELYGTDWREVLGYFGG